MQCQCQLSCSCASLGRQSHCSGVATSLHGSQAYSVCQVTWTSFSTVLLHPSTYLQCWLWLWHWVQFGRFIRCVCVQVWHTYTMHNTCMCTYTSIQLCIPSNAPSVNTLKYINASLKYHFIQLAWVWLIFYIYIYIYIYININILVEWHWPL